jgi:hypothetical protein
MSHVVLDARLWCSKTAYKSPHSHRYICIYDIGNRKRQVYFAAVIITINCMHLCGLPHDRASTKGSPTYMNIIS